MTRNRRGERWYRRLLYLYPRDFRDEFGEEMTRLYRDRGRAERWWSLWASLLLDLARTAPWEHLAILRQDLRHAWRGLVRTPVLTLTAILTLALGVGASTAVFSVAHALLVRPLPYPEADRLVELFESNPASGGSSMRVSAPNYLSWVERSTSFEAIAAFNSTTATLTTRGDPEVVSGAAVTASLFRVLRVAPLVGRTLHAGDERPGSARVVVLSEPLWRSRFGSDPRIVGHTIALDGLSYQVVGVMPRTFREVGRAQASGISGGQVFLPMLIESAQASRGNHVLRVVGRLHRGVTLEHARNEMHVVASSLAREFPATNSNWSVRLESLSETTIEPQVRRSVLLVLGAVTMVFLIACSNVANLMLARATRRRAEIAVRTALGAGRSRLVRQLLTESSCLAAMSGVAGILGAAVTHPLLRSVLPTNLPRLDEVNLDAAVLGFGLLIAIVSGLAFGIAPALRASRVDLSQSLLLVGRATTDSAGVRLRQMLIASQVGVATMLLVGAALLLQGFVNLQRVPLGFEPDGVLTARMSLPHTRYSDPERTRRFSDALIEALLPSGQIGSAALASSAPFAPGVRASFRPVERAEGSTASSSEHAAEHFVHRAYFHVLKIPLLSGRTFDERDGANAPPVAIVSQRLARLLWPNGNALGQLVERDGRSHEVIGIVGDVRGSDTQGLRGGGPDREPRAAVYFAMVQRPQRTMTLLVRPSGDHAAAVAAIRRAVRHLDPALAVQQVRPLSDWVTESIGPTRLTTMLAAFFAASALLLASIGIYGVLAHTIASRTREIGVRMAIGAGRRRVIALVLRQGLTWTCGGIVLGLTGAFAAARVMTTVLYEVPARDPVTFAAAGGAVMLVALAACAIPAARAVRIDPTIAMRTE